MKITEHLIKDKQIVGLSSKGEPVLMVETNGGLFAFFTKGENGQVETLAAAAHKAIGAWMAEKKDPGLQWNKDFLKAEPNGPSDIKISGILRKAMFAPTADNLQKNISDVYIVYDPSTFVIGIMDESTIKEGITAGEIGRHCLIRNTSLQDVVCRIETHPLFKGMNYGNRA